MNRKVRRVVLLLCLLCCAGCPALDTSVGALGVPDAGMVGMPAPASDASTPSPEPRYIEAESGALSGGFRVVTDPQASGGAVLVPPSAAPSDDSPGPARARYLFEASAAGTYVIWGRIHSPDVLHNRFWVQVDGGPFFKWRISTGEAWYWDDFHDDTRYGTPLTFALDAGTHELVIADCVEGVALDRLYVTAGREVPPGNDTPCRPPHSIEVAGACLESCGSLQGRQCGAQACAGKPALPAYDCDVCCAGP